MRILKQIKGIYTQFYEIFTREQRRGSIAVFVFLFFFYVVVILGGYVLVAMGGGFI